MYITLSLFPLLLIIILAIMGMIGTARTSLLYLTVYGLIPLVGVGFLVLVSTVKQDDIGSGYLAAEGEEGERTGGLGGVKGLTDLGLVESYTDSHAVFDRIRSREGTHETAKLLANPHHFFRDHPLTVLALTVPASAVLVAFGVLGGLAPTSMDGLVDRPVVGTAVWVYIPLYLNFLPLAVFYEWNARSRKRITGKLSETLRKLSSANSTGLTLLDSIELVVDTSSGKLADEFATIGRQVSYGMSLRAAFVEFNNRYEVPRLARTVNLITKAQESSNRIAAVLTTAAQASENQDDIEREQRSQARMQVAIIIMTFFTLLAVMAILKVNFLDTMARVTEQSGGGGGAGAGAGGGASSLGSGLDVELMGLLFFHAVTIQAVSSGFIAGYIRSGDLLTGTKYAVVLPTFALITFAVI
jgi:flagellar protein FlaJ